MDYQVSRHVINIPDNSRYVGSEQLEYDFFLNPELRKVILGTVRYPDGTPAPCSVVKFFKLKHSSSDPETTSDLEPIGHAIADDSGQFLLGPVYPGDIIVLKIFYLSKESIQDTLISSGCTCEPDEMKDEDL